MTKNNLTTGDQIPHFELKDQDNRLFNVSEHLGKHPLVIYFYPKDDTPGCTAEACSFRDQYEDFTVHKAKVIGISSDSVQSHKDFAEKYRLPFTLLSDPDEQVRKQFGVPGSFLGVFPGRVSYVVDEEGIIQNVFNSQSKAVQHVEEAIKQLKTMY